MIKDLLYAVEPAIQSLLVPLIKPLVSAWWLLLFGLMVLYRKEIRNSLKGISPKCWRLWGLIVFLPCVASFLFLSEPYAEISDGFRELLLGKYLQQGEVLRVLKEWRHGLIYPHLCWLSFEIFGRSTESVSLITLAAATAAALFVFLMAFLAFKDQWAALCSSALFVFSYLFYYNVLLHKGLPMLAFAMTALTGWTCAAAFRKRTPALYLLAFVAACLTANVRMECWIYVAILAGGAVFFPPKIPWRRVPRTFPVSCATALAMLVSSLLVALANIRGMQGAWEATPGGLVESNLIKYSWHSASYLGYIAPRYLDWGARWFAPHRVWVLGLLAVSLFRMPRQARTTAAILLGAFLLYTTVILGYVGPLEGRYFVPPFALLLPLVGLGLWKVLRLAPRRRGPGLLMASGKALLLLALLFLNLRDVHLYSAGDPRRGSFSGRGYWHIVEAHRIITERTDAKGTSPPVILVVKKDLADAWEFLVDLPAFNLSRLYSPPPGPIRLPAQTPRLAKASTLYYFRPPNIEDNYMYKAVDHALLTQCRPQRLGAVTDWKILELTGCRLRDSGKDGPQHQKF